MSEGEGSSFLVLAVASLPNEKYISIRGRGLGRGSIKLSIADTGRADDGKGQAITLVSAGEGSFSDGKQVFTSRVPLNCFLGREGVRGRDRAKDHSLSGGVSGFPKWP